MTVTYATPLRRPRRRRPPLYGSPVLGEPYLPDADARLRRTGLDAMKLNAASRPPRRSCAAAALCLQPSRRGSPRALRFLTRASLRTALERRGRSSRPGILNRVLDPHYAHRSSAWSSGRRTDPVCQFTSPATPLRRLRSHGLERAFWWPSGRLPGILCPGRHLTHYHATVRPVGSDADKLTQMGAQRLSLEGLYGAGRSARPTPGEPYRHARARSAHPSRPRTRTVCRATGKAPWHVEIADRACDRLASLGEPAGHGRLYRGPQ